MNEVDEALLKESDPKGLYIGPLSRYDYMMSPEEVGDFLGQSSQAVTNYLRSKELIGVKAGGRWRIPKKCLIEFMYENANRE